MGKKKLIHFQENLTFPHLFQPAYQEIQSDFYLKSKWDKDFFRNQRPVTIELGCGKGEYTVGLAARYPEKNFIGIDIKGSRIWKGAKTAVQNGMANVAFLRTQIDFIESFFQAGEVQEIWITFPDPQLKKARKRLTSSQFLKRYQKFLKKDGFINLKTDSAELLE